MSKPSVILIGGGGHCRSCIDVIEAEDKLRIRGILDAAIPVGEKVDGYEVLGSDSLIGELVKAQCYFLITVGQIRTPEIRKTLFGELQRKGARLATVQSPVARISRRAVIGEGTIIMHGAVINTGAEIGTNNIINTQSLIEHEAKTGNHVHISTRAILNGQVTVGEGCFVGSNAVIANNLRVAGNVVIGAGSVVVHHIKARGIYFGNPAKKIR